MSTYGSLPECWQEVELLSVASVITDGAHSSPKPQTQGRFMCSVKDMTYNKFDFSNVKLISEEDYQFLVKQGCAPQKGDLLISKDGANCLDLLFLYDQEEEIVLLSSIAIVRLKDTVCKEYVRYFLLSPDCQFIMRNNYVSGSAIPRVVLKDFKKVPIALPPLPEQKAIASVLSSLDNKIDLLHRQNKTLEAMAETLFRQWFIEEAKEDWEDGVLGDIASNVRVNATIESIESDEIYIGLEHIERRNVALSQHGFGSDVASNKSRFKKHDILFGKLRPYFHKVCITPFDGICSTDILVLRAKETVWTAFTLFAFFQDSVVEYANLASGGTRMPRADWGSLSQYPIAIPPIGLVHQFNELVLPSIEKTHTNLEQIQTLENLRDTLLPKLMSGEVRVQYQTEEVA